MICVKVSHPLLLRWEGAEKSMGGVGFAKGPKVICHRFDSVM